MELLEFLDIVDTRTFKKWALLNHPDKGGVSAKYVLVSEAYQTYILKTQLPKSTYTQPTYTYPTYTYTPPPPKPPPKPKTQKPPSDKPKTSEEQQCKHMVKDHKTKEMRHCQKTRVKDSDFCKMHGRSAAR